MRQGNSKLNFIKNCQASWFSRGRVKISNILFHSPDWVSVTPLLLKKLKSESRDLSVKISAILSIGLNVSHSKFRTFE